MTRKRLCSPTCFSSATALLLVVVLLGGVCSAQTTPAGPATQAAKDKQKKKKDKEKQAGKSGPATTARRPYRAVFGGARTELGVTKALDFNGGIAEAYDQDLLAEVSSPNAPRTAQSDGFYTNLNGDLTFRRMGSRLEGVVNGGATARYYAGLNEFYASDYHAAAGVSARTSARQQVRFNQAFSFAPVDLLGIFASALPPALGDVRPPTTDYAVNSNRSYTNSTSAELNTRLSSRSDFTLTSGLRLTHFPDRPEEANGFREFGAGGLYLHGLSASAKLRLGYSYRKANFQGTPLVAQTPLNPAEHNLDIGVDFNRPLSESRRTSMILRTGAAIVRAPLPSNTQVLRQQLRLLIDGSVLHQMGETWQVVGNYRSGPDFVERLGGPVFTQAWVVSANGFMSPRADFASSVSYSSGEPTLAITGQNFTTYTGNARLRVALGQRWAATAEYVYYFYDFSKTPLLVPGLPPRFNRNLLRVGLSLWAPIRRQ